jgi:hypothetical protein
MALAVVRGPELPMQVTEVRDCVRNLVTGNGSIHSEGLLL